MTPADTPTWRPIETAPENQVIMTTPTDPLAEMPDGTWPTEQLLHGIRDWAVAVRFASAHPDDGPPGWLAGVAQRLDAAYDILIVRYRCGRVRSGESIHSLTLLLADQQPESFESTG